MKAEKIWFVKAERGRKHVLTLYQDGYVMDEKGKKMFVLQKAAMQQVRNLVNEYSSFDDNSNDDPNLTIKCNNNPIFVSHNTLFCDQLADLLFRGENIKHPPEELDLIIDEINILRINNELNDLINQDGVKKFVDNLILKYYNSSVI